MAPYFTFPPPPPPPPPSTPTGAPSNEQPPANRFGVHRGGNGYNGRGYNQGQRGGRGGCGNRNAGGPVSQHWSGQNGSSYNQQWQAPSFQSDQYEQKITNPHKRKRGSDMINQQSNRGGGAKGPSPSQVRRRNPQLNVAPSVPGFGAPLLLAQNLIHSGSVESSKGHRNHKRAKLNQLGLAPDSDEHSEDDGKEEAETEEDIDEEAAYADTKTPGVCSFEYNGQTFSLSSPSEIAAWIRERRKLYPTADRVKEKRKEEETQRVADERVRQAAREADTRSRKPVSKGAGRANISLQKERPFVVENRNLEDRKKSMELPAASTSKDKVEPRSITETPKKPFPPGLGINYSSDSDSQDGEGNGKDDASSVISSSSALSSDSESDHSDDSDDDGPPVEEPIKPSQPLRVAPPKRQPKAKESHPKVCKRFQQTGFCPRGKKCRDKHTIEKQRKNLYQQLVEQEKQKDDQLTVQAIVALGKSGFFDAP